MARPVRPLKLDSDQIQLLRTIVGRRSGPQRMVMRANIVLFRGQGLSQQEVAARLGIERVVVSKWENRFRREGMVVDDLPVRFVEPPAKRIAPREPQWPQMCGGGKSGGQPSQFRPPFR